MIAGLQAAQVVLIIILGLSGLACLFWLIAIGCIELGDLIHRLASRSPASRDNDQ